MLERIASKQERLVIGIMSGGSADGVDVCLMRLRGGGFSLSWDLLGHDTLEYSLKVRDLILRCAEPGGGDSAAVCRLNVLLGELFAQGAVHIAARAGVDMKSIDIIGSHGQTVQHLPAATTITGIPVRGSLQVGEPAVIAERTGVTTVANFRARDMAAGGEGSPLLSYVDYLLLRHRARGRLVISVGGIASLTGIPASAPVERVVGFDTGPGTMLIDGLVARVTGDRERYDHDGRYARRGKVIPELLERLMGHPFLQREPPRSCGREEFGRPWIDGILKDNGEAAFEDLIATCTQFTAESIATACRRFVMAHHVYEEGIICGGGVRNGCLMDLVRAAIPELPIHLSDDYGLPAIAKESMAIAILANETIQSRSNNLPAATGASHAVVLGTIVAGADAR